MKAGWRTITIGELCDIGNGSVQTGPFGSQLHASDYVEDGIPTVMPVNLGENRIIEDSIARVSRETQALLSRHCLKDGDIVYGRRGDIGRRALVSSYEEGWLCGTGCLRIRFGNAPVDSRYISHYLGLKHVKELILSKAIGTTMPNLNTEILRSVPIVLPSLSMQKSIADILSRLDDKIECNHRINQTLEAMVQALYKHWFVDFGPFRSGGIVESELGQIPVSWRISSLGHLFPDRECVITGPFGSNLHASDYSEQGIPLILVKHVDHGRVLEEDIPLVGEHKLPELERYRLKKGDIVFTRVGVVGQSSYIRQRQTGWLISGQLLRVRVTNTSILTPRYLAQVYLQPTFIGMVENFAVGSTRPSLNTNLLRSFQFLIPPIAVQSRFEKAIEPMDSLIENNLEESRHLAQTRDYLLPKLMAGEIEIKVAQEAAERELW